MNGPHRVFDGWMGAGYGANFCNLCSCQGGVLACRKKVCASHENNGKQCSHTFCTFSYTSESPHEKVMNIIHHHLEAHGVHHHCNYNLYTSACSCHCWTGALDYHESQDLPSGAAGFFHKIKAPRYNYARPLAYESNDHWHHWHDRDDRVYELTAAQAEQANADAAAEKMRALAKQKALDKRFGVATVRVAGSAGYLAWHKSEQQRLRASEKSQKRAELDRKAAYEENWQEQVDNFFADKDSSEPSYAEALAEVQASEAAI